ncbi:MAG: hypothetical protein MUF86_17285 [Akkermansiaceae bacterium]|nr:hypothetical protein [Akkermansiaceae bacterium]
MRRGTISEQYFERQGPGGRKVRFGPYYKFQIWQDGRNQTRSVAAGEARTLREDIGNFHRFEELCEQLARINIQHTIALRTPAAPTPESAEKKTSKPTASPKNTAGWSASSPGRASGSRGRKASKR